MGEVTIIGLDTAKRFFQVHGVNARGKAVIRKKLSREKVLPFFANPPCCLVGIEATGGSHYWAREIAKFGHRVGLMPPQFVKPYVKTNKNDANDAEAICEAVARPNMRFVPIKSIEQQDIMALHRIRSRLVGQRTALVAELGVILPQGIRHLRQALPVIVEDLDSGLNLQERDYLSDLYTEMVDLDARIAKHDKRFRTMAASSDACRRLLGVPGIGPLAATALVATVGDAAVFKNGRQLSAWLGLVPRQNSSGGKTRLHGISKRGDVYLRTLLIHGAWAVIRQPGKRDDPVAEWARKLLARRGKDKAVAAMANKTARMAWVVLARGEAYRKAA